MYPENNKPCMSSSKLSHNTIDLLRKREEYPPTDNQTPCFKTRGPNTNKNRVEAATCYATDKVFERRSSCHFCTAFKVETGRDLYNRIVLSTGSHERHPVAIKYNEEEEEETSFVSSSSSGQGTGSPSSKITFDGSAVTSNFRELNPSPFL